MTNIRARHAHWWQRVPAVIWALLLPALIIAGLRLLYEPRAAVVVGAGPVAILEVTDAPSGFRYALEIVASEGHEATATRVEEEIRDWPDVLVIGLDDATLIDERTARASCALLGTLAHHAENAVAIPVLLGFDPAHATSRAHTAAITSANHCLREVVCTQGTTRLCVDIQGTSPAELRDRVRNGVLDARVRLARQRASTQVGR